MFFEIFIIAFVILISFIGFMVFKAQHDHVRTYTIKDGSFPKNRKLSIFFISDIHNRVIQKETLEHVNEPDMIIIGGDLADTRTTKEKLEVNLRRLKEKGVPVYFVPGNNDHEFEYGNVMDVLHKEGVHTLSNEDVLFYLDENTPIMLSGMDPYFMGPRRTMGSIEDKEIYQILCVHDPLVFKRMNSEDKEKFNLALSGHTHGGQIRLFGAGPYQRGGWSNAGTCQLLVSEGYGTSLLPLRLGTQAECHIITIQS